MALTVNQSRLYGMIITLNGLLNKALCLLVSSFKILEFIYLAKINLAHSVEPFFDGSLSQLKKQAVYFWPSSKALYLVLGLRPDMLSCNQRRLPTLDFF